MSWQTAPDKQIVVTGLGVCSGLGHGKAAFLEGLLAGSDVFGPLTRAGRQTPDDSTCYLGVEMPDLPPILPPRIARTTTLPERAAVSAIHEAWHEAALDKLPAQRIGLIVGGSNLAAREYALALETYSARPAHTPPRHAHLFFDTDLCGLCCSQFAIRGFAHTLGGASASGALAVIEAVEAVKTGRVDACIALGAMQDPSLHDLRAFAAIGAMNTTHYQDTPGEACRPFDREHSGFVYGEACAAIVVQRAGRNRMPPYARIPGTAALVDGARGPEPDSTAQVRAARLALQQAGLATKDIDYVNGHATGTPLGDKTELASYRELGLDHAYINTTKSITGHGLSAAGALEIVALLLQMRNARLHPSRNLQNPLEPDFNWVRSDAVAHQIRYALKLSFGFAGINTAMVFAVPDNV